MGVPYAFRPRKKCVIMPYAFGIDKDGRPDAEARTRLDKAFASAKEKIK